MVIINVIILLLASYLLGSFNTAYFLGRLVKGIDIRKYGTTNAGALNVSRVLGLRYSIITAVVDMFKAFIPVTASYLMGMPDFMLLIVYVAVLLGHVFPFYLNWRGGYGVSASFGAALGLIYPLINNLELLVIYWFIIAIFYFISSTFILVPLREPWRILKGKLKPWRKVLRFAALIFPIWYLIFDKSAALYLLVIILAIFITLDILRAILPKAKKFFILRALMKEGEKKISGITLLLISILISFILFPRDVAILITVMVIIGDNMAVLVGTKFGIIKLVGKKSLEGSLAFLGSAFFIGLLLINLNLINVSFWFVLIAASVCAIIELISEKVKIDDNLLVQIAAGIIMSLLRNIV